jgi:hypothetical protein
MGARWRWSRKPQGQGDVFTINIEIVLSPIVFARLGSDRTIGPFLAVFLIDPKKSPDIIHRAAIGLPCSPRYRPSALSGKGTKFEIRNFTTRGRRRNRLSRANSGEDRTDRTDRTDWESTVEPGRSRFRGWHENYEISPNPTTSTIPRSRTRAGIA